MRLLAEVREEAEALIARRLGLRLPRDRETDLDRALSETVRSSPLPTPEACLAWLANLPEDLKLRLGVYDPEINVRCAVLASTLPIEDESTAVLAGADSAAPSAYTVRFQQAPLVPCRIVFEGGIELTAYSVVRYNDLVWLRLKWTVRQGGLQGLRFFGHAVTEPSPEIAAVAQFDQDMAIERRGPATVVEQNIVRALGSAAPPWLRAGVFKPSNLKRLKILSGTAVVEEGHRCVYLRLQGPE